MGSFDVDWRVRAALVTLSLLLAILLFGAGVVSGVYFTRPAVELAAQARSSAAPSAVAHPDPSSPSSTRRPAQIMVGDTPVPAPAPQPAERVATAELDRRPPSPALPASEAPQASPDARVAAIAPEDSPAGEIAPPPDPEPTLPPVSEATSEPAATPPPAPEPPQVTAPASDVPPATASPARDAVPSVPQPAPAKPPALPARTFPVAKPVPPVSSGGAYRIQFGAFASEENATRLSRTLSTPRMRTTVVAGQDSAGNTRYFVRSPTFPDQASALAAAEQAQARERTAYFVTRLPVGEPADPAPGPSEASPGAEARPE